MPRPTIHQLEIFCKVVQLKSMARAAEELYLAPSSVTMQVQQLEHKYLTQLLVRSSRGVIPTAAGRALHSRAMSVLRDIDAAEHELAGMRSLDTGVLQFSASRTIGTYLVPSVLSLFQKAYPNVAVEYYIKSGGDQARFAVLEQLVEFAILGRVKNETVLAVDALLDEPMQIVVSPDHPFTAVEAPGLSDLGRHSLLLRQGRILSRDYIVDALTRTSGPLDIQEFGNTEAIKEAAIEGRGVAILPQTSVAAEIATGQLVSRTIPGFTPTRTAYVVRPSNVPLSAAASAFLTLAQQLHICAPALAGDLVDVGSHAERREALAGLPPVPAQR
jgi:DNA-binding transcriptional LysR family regulator